MAKILVTGASGLLGANLALIARDSHEVVACYFRNPIEVDGVFAISSDLSLKGSAISLISRVRPDWVIHCAAATDVDGCERDPQHARRLNRDMAGFVAAASRDARAGLIHVSTDAVFGGADAPYSESSRPSPLSAYGKSKLDGERAVRAAHPGAVVVRTAMYGWNARAKLSLAEWFIRRFELGQRTVGFTDAFFTPILVNDLAETLLKLQETEVAGLYHIGGGECVSKYDFGLAIGRIFGYDTSLLKKGSHTASDLNASRASNLCLDSSRAAVLLDWQPPSVFQGLERLRHLREEGYARILRSLVEVNSQ